MDPFGSSSSPEDWWAEVDLPCSPEISHSYLETQGQSHLPALPPLPAAPSDTTASPRRKSSSKQKAHARSSPKDQYLRAKEAKSDLFVINEEAGWNDLLQDMYLNEMAISPNICPSEASTTLPQKGSSFIFKTTNERDSCVQSILSCTDQGDLEQCTTGEKRRIADELKARLVSIESGIASLKDSLKKLIKDKI